MPRRRTNEFSLNSKCEVSLRSVSVPRFALRRDEAAASLGISETTFDSWIAKGLMPQGRKIDGVRLWDVGELARAWAQLRDRDAFESENPFDGVTA